MKKYLWWGVGLSLVIGMGLTLASGLGLCDLKCSQAADYRLFGYPFEVAGGLFFAVAILLFALRAPTCLLLVLLGACGAEVVMLTTQALVIGEACPLCMGIAATVYTATGLMVYLQLTKSNILKWSVLPVVVAVVVTVAGITKVDSLEAAVPTLKEEIRFGEQDRPLEAYLFTDWGCSGCKKVEPRLARLIPLILSRASLVFVDYPVHPITYNYMPHNLSLMVHEKEKYLDSRIALGQLAEEVFNPDERQVVDAVRSVGGNYQSLSYLEVAQGLKFFEEIREALGVKYTPTLVVINRKTGEKKMLVGSENITEESVNDLIR